MNYQVSAAVAVAARYLATRRILRHPPSTLWVPIINNKPLVMEMQQHLMRARKQHFRRARVLSKKQHQHNSNHRPLQRVTCKAVALTNGTEQTRQSMKGLTARKGKAPLMGQAKSNRRTRRGAEQGSASAGVSASSQGLMERGLVTKLMAKQGHITPAVEAAAAAAAVPAAVAGAAGVVQTMRAKVQRLVGTEVGPTRPARAKAEGAARAEARGAGAGKERVRQLVV
jgi:hypothetical protein